MPRLWCVSCQTLPLHEGPYLQKPTSLSSCSTSQVNQLFCWKGFRSLTCHQAINSASAGIWAHSAHWCGPVPLSSANAMGSRAYDRRIDPTTGHTTCSCESSLPPGFSPGLQSAFDSRQLKPSLSKTDYVPLRTPSSTECHPVAGGSLFFCSCLVSVTRVLSSLLPCSWWLLWLPSKCCSLWCMFVLFHLLLNIGVRLQPSV